MTIPNLLEFEPFYDDLRQLPENSAGRNIRIRPDLPKIFSGKVVL
jgi:hypothetical protein